VKVNPKDLLFKAFWTAVAAGLSFLGAELADVGEVWVPVAMPWVTIALAYARQQLGATPPDAPAEGVFARPPGPDWP
jgi:hypothetical protein